MNVREQNERETKKLDKEKENQSADEKEKKIKYSECEPYWTPTDVMS